MNLDSQHFEVAITEELGTADLEQQDGLHGVREYC